jgi:hypothetical protein
MARQGGLRTEDRRQRTDDGRLMTDNSNLDFGIWNSYRFQLKAVLGKVAKKSGGQIFCFEK